MSIEKIARFVGHFLLLPYPRLFVVQKEVDVSRATFVDWSNFCREVTEKWVADNSTGKLGGVGKTVEIDETLISRRKYNRGRIIKQTWVFGCFERESRKIFITPVVNRSAETLLGFIKNHIENGTTIISDCWKAYDLLSNEGFTHLKVNHSLNFVDPISGAHTQNIERLWRDVKNNIPKFGRQHYHLNGYLAEFMFKRSIPYEMRFRTFFETTKNMY